MELTGTTFIVVPVLVFIAVLLFVEGLYLYWRAAKGPQARKLQQRLESFSFRHTAAVARNLLKQRPDADLPGLQRLLVAVPWMHGLERLLDQSGLHWSLSRVFTLSAAAAVLAGVVTAVLLHVQFLVAVGCAVLASALPFGYIVFQRAARLHKIEQQLPDALDLISRGLRAGHAFSSTLKMAGEELLEPIGKEFRTVHEEINFGVALPQALTNLCERVPSTDVRYFVVAVLIQRESGGNLTEILTNLSKLVRERLKLLARVRVLCTEGKMSAWVLCLLPFALAGLMNVFNPGFMRPLWTDPIGLMILKVMLTLMLLGVIALRYIIRIRV